MLIRVGFAIQESSAALGESYVATHPTGYKVAVVGHRPGDRWCLYRPGTKQMLEGFGTAALAAAWADVQKPRKDA
jgi:hypothetical protein